MAAGDDALDEGAAEAHSSTINPGVWRSKLVSVASTSAPRTASRPVRSRLGAQLAGGWRSAAGHGQDVGVWTLVTALGTGLALLAFGAQSHYTAQYDLGATLNGWQNLLREGDPWQATLPAIVAGALALVGWRRLLNATPEPTIGLPGMERVSAPALRSTLRRERRLVLGLVDFLTALVVLAVVRLPVYLGLAVNGSTLARDTLPGVAVQAVVWLACGACFWLWRARYLSTLESWGVRGDG